MKKEKLLPLATPGKVLSEEFLKPLEITENQLARNICVPARRINEIVRGVRAVTPDTALRMSRYFGTTPQFWMNLQTDYELRRIIREKGLPKIECRARHHTSQAARTSTVKPTAKKLKPDAFSASVGRALRRAAKVARKTARMHGTRIYVWKDGKVVALKP